MTPLLPHRRKRPSHFQLTRQATQQTLLSNEQERHNLQRRLAELQAAAVDADRLRIG